MERISKKISFPAIAFSIMLVLFSANIADAQMVPEWVKNNALWYGQGIVSETEFLNAVKFLIENDIIKLERTEEVVSEIIDATVIIPNGNFDVTGAGFYSPLNLEIP